MNKELGYGITIALIGLAIGLFMGNFIYAQGNQAGDLAQQQNTIFLGADKLKEGVGYGVNLALACEKNCGNQTNTACLETCINKNKGW